MERQWLIPPTDTSKKIASRIHRWRVEANYTLQELAQRSGVAAGTTRATALFFGTIPKGLHSSISERTAKLKTHAQALGMLTPCEDETADFEARTDS